MCVRWTGEGVQGPCGVLLWLDTAKTKELVVDFRRSKTPYQLVCIDGGEMETVQTCKYLGVGLDNKLEWSDNIEVV